MHFMHLESFLTLLLSTTRERMALFTNSLYYIRCGHNILKPEYTFQSDEGMVYRFQALKFSKRLYYKHSPQQLAMLSLNPPRIISALVHVKCNLRDLIIPAKNSQYLGSFRFEH